jgi:hypothetical protein
VRHSGGAAGLIYGGSRAVSRDRLDSGLGIHVLPTMYTAGPPYDTGPTPATAPSASRHYRTAMGRVHARRWFCLRLSDRASPNTRHRGPQLWSSRRRSMETARDEEGRRRGPEVSAPAREGGLRCSCERPLRRPGRVPVGRARRARKEAWKRHACIPSAGRRFARSHHSGPQHMATGLPVPAPPAMLSP